MLLIAVALLKHVRAWEALCFSSWEGMPKLRKQARGKVRSIVDHSKISAVLFHSDSGNLGMRCHRKSHQTTPIIGLTESCCHTSLKSILLFTLKSIIRSLTEITLCMYAHWLFMPKTCALITGIGPSSKHCCVYRFRKSQAEITFPNLVSDARIKASGRYSHLWPSGASWSRDFRRRIVPGFTLILEGVIFEQMMLVDVLNNLSRLSVCIPVRQRISALQSE